MQEAATRETQTLRRALRDVLALSAMPSVWSGYDTAQIANNLADVLMRLLACDAVYLTLRSQHAEDVLRMREPADGELEHCLRELAAGPLRTE
ncbi:MAG: hypothetical protein QOH21_3289, partial [Acidobacteriota bacterium]|nr:hypothetical protein [Acidobacteriota bacterium]